MNSATVRRWLHDPYILALIILVCIAIVLRFYHFYGFVTYLGDQGRDSIVIRRIATLEDFPAIGASSSVGNVFLGPFYYYFAAPWLILSQFDPVGPAVGVGIMSVLSIPLLYVAMKDLFNKKVAILTVLFTTFSYSLIWLARFSWNPNLLPVSSLFTLYFFIKGLQTKDWRHFFASGVLLSISTQFHYVALAYGIPMALYLIKHLYDERKKISAALLNIGAMAGGFILFHAPLIIFDLKNNFLNLRGFAGAFQESHASGRPFIEEILYTMSQFHKYAISFEIKELGGAVVLAVLLGLLVLWRTKQHTAIRLVTVFFVLMFVVTSFLTNVKNLHYFGALYPLYFVILAYILAEYFWNKKFALMLIAAVIGFIVLQRETLNFFMTPGSNLISRAHNISQKIYDESEGKTLQITSLPDGYGDYMYRYYMELWGKRPVERASLIKADELFVVCEDPCKPIGDPQWDIAYFEPTKVVGTWDVEDVTIYKLTR